MTLSIFCMLFVSFGFCGEAIPSGMTLEQPKPVYQSTSKKEGRVRTEGYPCTPYPLCKGTNANVTSL